MSNRNPPDPDGDARAMLHDDFCSALIKAADSTGGGIKWRPFMNRSTIKRELARRGYELCEESADFDPTKKRFFAMKLEVPIHPEYP